MTNETVANIAVTVTAAMLATAAVAFTVSGNAPVDPRAADLPVVSIGATTAHAAASGTATSAAPSPGVALSGSGSTLKPHAPTSASKPGVSSGVAVSSGAASAVKGTGTSSTKPGGRPLHDPDEEEEDDHEVVVPKVHESDED